MGQRSQSHIDCCPVKRGRQEYRGSPGEAERRLSDPGLGRILGGMVRGLNPVNIPLLKPILSRHEHIYEAIEKRLICSDALNSVKDKVEVERHLNGSVIVLSTLGMLSNPALHLIGMFRVVPLQTLVIDEASQIRIEEFMVRVLFTTGALPSQLYIVQHLFVKFSQTLEKVCFFGDPKQRKLGVSLLQTLFTLMLRHHSTSIWQRQSSWNENDIRVKHLHHSSLFLDTQCM